MGHCDIREVCTLPQSLMLLELTSMSLISYTCGVRSSKRHWHFQRMTQLRWLPSPSWRWSSRARVGSRSLSKDELRSLLITDTRELFWELLCVSISWQGRISVRFFTQIIQSPSVYLRYSRYFVSPMYPHAVEVVFFQTLLSSLFDRASLFCVNE